MADRADVVPADPADRAVVMFTHTRFRNIIFLLLERKFTIDRNSNVLRIEVMVINPKLRSRPARISGTALIDTTSRVIQRCRISIGRLVLMSPPPPLQQHIAT